MQRKMIELFLAKDLEDVKNEWNEVFKYEKEADEVKRKNTFGVI